VRVAAAGLVLLAGACSGDDAPPPGAAAPTPPDTVARVVVDAPLQAALRAAVAEFDGEVGAVVLHVEGDTVAALDGGRAFPLASVTKLPIAWAAVQRTPAGDSVGIEPADRAPGLTHFVPGTRVPLDTVVARSLSHSDNTGADAMLRAAGGAAEATRQVRALGIDDVRVDRSMRRLFADWNGVPDADSVHAWSFRSFQARRSAVGRAARDSARAAYLADPRDTGSAAGIAALLASIQRGEGLAPDRRLLLLEAMRATVTGPDRIAAGLPAGTGVARKTGTLGPLTHDVGIVALPDGRGHLAIAVLVRSDGPEADAASVIAAVARAAWTRFAGEDAAP
jgi:beta-lactamase class A